jgi:very-short-patch-repair endonuclease
MWPDRAISGLATAQHGQVHRHQLLKLGVSRSAVGRGVARGRLHPTFTAVYGVGHNALPPLWREHGATLACGEGAFVSRHRAAAAWQLRPPARGDVEVTVPYGRNNKRAGIRIHRATVIDPRDVTTLEGIPIATPAFALLEIAADLTFEKFERAFDDALTKRVMMIVDACETLDRHRGHPGAGMFAELARPEQRLEVTRAWTEQRMKVLVRKGGLPTPIVNVRRGRIIPDFIWRPERVVVEVDGYRTHGTRRAFESDRARDARLAAEGWVVLRFTARQLKREPEVVLVRIAQTLAIRRRAA